ncbi:MAG: response regulator transcription factor [Pseudomonadota bacterium]
MSRRILIIEDEPDIARLLRLHLRELAEDPQIANDGSEGLRLALASRWDLILLDLRLPGVDGLEICRRLRQQPYYVPIVMLTSKSGEGDRVSGLDIGADDYITKPFSIPELLARIKAIFRRVELLERGDEPASELRAGELQIDLDRREVHVGDKAIDLTAKEFDLLTHFARAPGKVFTRAQLLDSVWGYGHDGYEHTVNTHINRLRAKVEPDPSNPTYVMTVWGVGYKFGVDTSP